MIKVAYLDPAGSLATTATENVWEHGYPSSVQWLEDDGGCRW